MMARRESSYSPLRHDAADCQLGTGDEGEVLEWPIPAEPLLVARAMVEPRVRSRRGERFRSASNTGEHNA